MFNRIFVFFCVFILSLFSAACVEEGGELRIVHVYEDEESGEGGSDSSVSASSSSSTSSVSSSSSSSSVSSGGGRLQPAYLEGVQIGWYDLWNWTFCSGGNMGEKIRCIPPGAPRFEAESLFFASPDCTGEKAYPVEYFEDQRWIFIQDDSVDFFPIVGEPSFKGFISGEAVGIVSFINEVGACEQFEPENEIWRTKGNETTGNFWAELEKDWIGINPSNQF